VQGASARAVSIDGFITGRSARWNGSSSTPRAKAPRRQCRQRLCRVAARPVQGVRAFKRPPVVPVRYRRDSKAVVVISARRSLLSRPTVPPPTLAWRLSKLEGHCTLARDERGKAHGAPSGGPQQQTLEVASRHRGHWWPQDTVIGRPLTWVLYVRRVLVKLAYVGRRGEGGYAIRA
jgi:hypothetical protein